MTTKEHEAPPKHETKHEKATAQSGGSLEWEEPFTLAGPAGPEAGPRGTIQASASNADGATTTTAASAFLGGGDVVTCQCTNPASGLTNACQVILLLSADAVTYYRVASEWFGMAASGVYFATFNMADYTDRPDQFGLTLPWLWYKIQFKGNIGAAVTVAATNSGT